MEPILNLALAASCVILAAAVSLAASASPFEPQESVAKSPEAARSLTGEEQNIEGKIESVDETARTVKIEKLDKTIVLTDSTRYAAGLDFASLKAGLAVKSVASPRSDGRMEAIEVSAAS
ncbi:MAG: hypothetical protein C0504_14000 [Candidatus Solibacter sp.]|nr:hypothetical protein [Candidatus Solibacter sp.]